MIKTEYCICGVRWHCTNCDTNHTQWADGVGEDGIFWSTGPPPKVCQRCNPHKARVREVVENYDLRAHTQVQKKMYILIRDSLDPDYAVVAAAHASLMVYLKFKDDPDVVEWLKSFRKVVCKVNNEEFELARKVNKHVIITESALGGVEVAIAFCPREKWPGVFKSFVLYRA